MPIIDVDPPALQTAARANARAARVQIITLPGALTRSGQKQLVDDVTRIVADICDDRSQKRTRVLLTEAAEGGWGINGTAYGRDEFAALARRP
jgi:phenylpyruvate tautomerase PptA (4-oxalocrotonate tautomerase family)